MDTGETVRMIRVPGIHRRPSWQEADTVEHRAPEYESGEFIETPESEYYSPYLTPSEIKQRQVAYMTAAVMWFVLLCIGVIVGSFVWKICLVIAAS